MAGSLEYTYKYGFQSGLKSLNTKPRLSLATSDVTGQQAYFFDGKMRYPKVTADMLLTLNDVVRTHYFLPVPPFTDPVLTSNENLLRVEGFSGCCGVYVRADLPAEMFEGDCHKKGTTNVDFNQAMRKELSKIRDNDEIQFSIGHDEVTLARNAEKTIEKKVKMPLRWIKGFSEVQAYQSRLNLNMEVSAAEAIKFIRYLPKTAMPKKPVFAVSSGKGLRLTQRVNPSQKKSSVPILGTHRLKSIEHLLFKAQTLRVWSDEHGTSAWEVCFSQGSFFLMISPEVYRGFSGEGQVLSDLAHAPNEQVIATIKAQLKWQEKINVSQISQLTSLKEAEVQHALSVLGSRGLVGYDSFNGHYYHRELPFDFEQVEQLQPRLKAARKLIDANGVSCVSGQQTDYEYFVGSSDVIHRVKLNDSLLVCTCPWFSKYKNKRGPCKHILAAQLFQEGMSTP